MRVAWLGGKCGSDLHLIPAARLGREESARLAAIIPSPLTRKPARLEQLSGDILEKMRNMGW